MKLWFRTLSALVKANLISIARSRIYVGLVAAGVLLIFFSLMLAQLSAGEMTTALIDIGLAFVALVVSIMCILTTTSGISTNARALIPIIARPIDRSAFIVARFAAVSIVSLISSCALGLLLSGLVAYFGGPAVRTLVAAVAGGLEGILLTAVASLLAAQLSPTVALSLSFVVLIVGRLDSAMTALVEKGTFGVLTPVARGVSYILPHLSQFNFSDWLHLDNGSSIVTPFLYCFLYSFGTVTISARLFQRRDLL